MNPPTPAPIDVLAGITKLAFIYSTYTKSEVYGTGLEMGLIPEQIQQFFPQAISMGRDGALYVQHEFLIPVLMKAIQELMARVKVLEEKNGGQ